MGVYDHNIQTVDSVADLANVSMASGQLVQTLGYYAASDGGANVYRYDSESAAAIDGGFVIDGPGSVGRFLAVDQTVANVRRFGATGDGVTDDTASLQAAIDSADVADCDVEVPPGRYATDNLFFGSSGSLLGHGKAELYLAATPTESRWINVGYKNVGATTAFPLTGRIDGLTFTMAPGQTASELLHIAHYDRGTVSNCTFNTNGNVGSKVLGISFNDSYYFSGAVFRDGITVKDNRFNMQLDASESIGAGNGKNVFISRNTITESGDDLGVHTCEGVRIENNTVESTSQPRIYLSDSQDAVITGNRVKYSGLLGGMGIYVGQESTSTPNVVRRVSVTNNEIVFGSGITTTGAAVGIRLEGPKSTTVTGNHLYDETSVVGGVARIAIENQNLVGWVDPDGVDPNDSPQCRDVVVSRNMFHGDSVGVRVVNSDIPGPVIVSENMGGVAYVAAGGSEILVRDNIYSGPVLAKIISPQRRGRAVAKFAITKGAGNKSAYLFSTLWDGSTSWTAPFACVFLNADVAFDQAVTSGFSQIQIFINGVQAGGDRTCSITPGEKLGNFVNSGSSTNTPLFELAKGDTLSFKLKSNNQVPDEGDFRIIPYVFPLELAYESNDQFALSEF